MFSVLTLLSQVLYFGFASYQHIKIDGDLIFGGLFPVHDQGDSGWPCGRLSEGRGIHRVEAMLFALDKINNDPVLLPGIRLGARILDTCTNPSHALNLSLVFVRELMGAELHKYRCADGTRPNLISNRQSVVGVIGGSYSGVSVQTAHLLRLFEIVQISPASTSSDLSDKTRFDFFARTVPSDVYQARAAADLCHRYNWTYVGLVYSGGEYGEALAEAFKNSAKNKHICIAWEAKLGKHSQMKTIVEQLFKSIERSDRGPRVVVLFTRGDDTRVLLQYTSLHVKRTGEKNRVQWLAADGWETRPITTRGWEDIAEDAFVITLESNPVPEFEKYFLSLTPANPITLRNQWFLEYWETKHNCSLRNSTRPSSSSQSSREYSAKKKPCKPNQRINVHEFQADDKVQFVIDAVYALAYALHGMWKDSCLGVKGVCPALRRVNGRQLYQDYLLNVSFTGVTKNKISFTHQGDGPSNYRFMNYQSVDGGKGKYDYVEVGQWRELKGDGILSMDEDRILWLNHHGRPPRSICAPQCSLGERKEMIEKSEGCCWACIPCASHQFMKDELTCLDCPDGYWPEEDRKTCFAMSIEHMHWDSGYSLAASSLAAVGVIMTLQVLAVYAKYWSTPVIKASGRELSCVILAGVMICFGVTFIVLTPPNKLICGLRRVAVGLGFAVLYSAMLVKTNRIYRIFTSAQTARRCRFISPLSQLVIAGILISFQVLTSLVWLAIDPPAVKLVYPTRSQVVAKCAQDDHWFLVSLGYDAMLIILCTVYAVKTRMVPENFNEAKFIGFTMYTTCIIWLAFVALYFGTESDFKVQLTTLSICITLSGKVALLCLYAPKVWICLFEPEKNVRRQQVSQQTFGSQWATLLVPNPNMYTPLLGLRPLPGTQNVFLAPPMNAFRVRTNSTNSNILNMHNGPNNHNHTIVSSAEITSEMTESY